MPQIISPRVGVQDTYWGVTPGTSGPRRARLHRQALYNHKPEWPGRMVQNPYALQYVIPKKQSIVAWPLNPNGNDRNPDMPNVSGFYHLMDQPWDSRLYATAYDKFMNAALDGTAEIGMNMIQYRQTLSMLLKYTDLSLSSVLSIKNAFKRADKWLQGHPWESTQTVQSRLTKRREAYKKSTDEKRQKRLGNEISILEEVSAALLAYRYGVAPLMADIYAVCDILSKDHNGDVVYRKSAKVTWGGRWDYSEQRDHFVGLERCVLTGRALVSNPNLLLANRLGVINPQLWVWDAIPFSFVVDWWLPVGKFLASFTSSVGLNVVESSVTRTREGTGKAEVLYAVSPNGTPEWRAVEYIAKRKLRTVGPLPLPFSVPYGTGLGIQRAQNALALLMQFSSKKLRSNL